MSRYPEVQVSQADIERYRQAGRYGEVHENQADIERYRTVRQILRGA